MWKVESIGSDDHPDKYFHDEDDAWFFYYDGDTCEWYYTPEEISVE